MFELPKHSNTVGASSSATLCLLACSKSWLGRWDGGSGGALDRRWEFHGTVGPGRHGAVTRRVLCGDTAIPASPRLEDLMHARANVVMGGDRTGKINIGCCRTNCKESSSHVTVTKLRRDQSSPAHGRLGRGRRVGLVVDWPRRRRRRALRSGRVIADLVVGPGDGAGIAVENRYGGISASVKGVS